MPRLIDLDQTIFVPIVDDSHGGATYEMQMTIAEFFDRFLDGFKPEVVDAIPVEWINEHRGKDGSLMNICTGLLLMEWQDEQEAR